MIAALLVTATLFGGPVDALVLRSGQTLPVSGEIREDGRRLVFRTAEGVLYSIALDEIDLEATRELALKSNAGAEPAEAAQAEEAPPPPLARKLAVSEQEKKRLLEEISRNRDGKPAPEQRSLTDEGLKDEMARLDRERDQRERDERYWRDRAGPARERLNRARDEAALLEARVRRLQDEVGMVVAVGLDPSGQLYQLDLARNQLDSARQRVGSAERAWADLQDEARRAGALPGWLR